MDNRWYKLQTNIKKHTQKIFSIGTGLISFALLCILTAIFNTSLCPIKYFFKKTCFGCGMTRAFISILSLDFISAIKYNVLSIPLFICIVIYCLFLAFDIIFGKQTVNIIEKQLAKKYMYILYFLILISSAVINNRI